MSGRHGLARDGEARYQAARFAEYRPFAMAVGIAGVALTLGLWLRDYTDDPLGARTTLPLRAVMASGVALYVLALWLPVRRGLQIASGYVAVLVIEFSVLAIWSRLASGYLGGFPGYMYLYLVTPLVLLPFSFRLSVWVLVLVGVVPNLQVALGMAPGFPSGAFNALVWPACGVAVFAQRQFDLLFRRVFAAQRELAELARRDPLTGLANRRDFVERAEALCASARRYGRAVSVLMVDIDNFKAVNDGFGHAAGDDVLRFLAALLALETRAADVCARIGGEEFAFVLDETGPEAARQAAERIRAIVQAAEVPTEHAARTLRVTVSIGIACATRDAALDALLREADAALYQAKKAGRNCIRAARRERLAAVPQPANA
jgi:diguanylate cyclase (GGDEF)-like protein